jgi:hypothetical protein
MDDLFSPVSMPKVIGSIASPVVEIIARIGDGPPRQFLGRVAWALHELVQSGAGGCTPITHPGPRWSDYILKIRRQGVVVETVNEGHGGAFAGTHAKYVLHSKVELVTIIRGEKRRASKAGREARHAA